MDLEESIQQQEDTLSYQIGLVKSLNVIKEQQDKLFSEKKDIIDQLPELVIFKNEDNTWTRFTKVDNISVLTEKGTIFRTSSLDRYTTSIEVLKNPPKELKEKDKGDKE